MTDECRNGATRIYTEQCRDLAAPILQRLERDRKVMNMTEDESLVDFRNHAFEIDALN